MLEESTTFQIHTSIKRQPIHHENISYLFFSRFNAISLNDLNQNGQPIQREYKKNNEIYFLLNATAIKHYNLNTYLELLIKYIAIGGTA